MRLNPTASFTHRKDAIRLVRLSNHMASLHPGLILDKKKDAAKRVFLKIQYFVMCYFTTNSTQYFAKSINGVQ